jgi:hypothetical protein
VIGFGKDIPPEGYAAAINLDYQESESASMKLENNSYWEVIPSLANRFRL